MEIPQLKRIGANNEFNNFLTFVSHQKTLRLKGKK